MQKKSILDTPENKKAVVQMMASGESQAEVARHLNISESQISRFANRDDIKQLIETEALKLMDCLPDAVENVTTLVKGMKHVPMSDHKNRDLAYRASLKTLETAGITPSQGQSSHVINIFQQNNEIFLDQAAANALNHLGIDSLKSIEDE
jgi:hypothetical protein